MRDFISFLAPQLRDYLTLKTSLGYSSFAEDSRPANLDHFLSFLQIGSYKQLNEDLLIRWIHALSHRSNATKNHLLVFARGFFDYLLRHGHLADNPARRIRLFKENRPRPYIYTLLEIHQILEAARKRPAHCNSPLLSKTLETVIFLTYACGLRLSEPLKLKIKDVDFLEKTLSLWGTKFHKERLVPFSPAVAQQLKDYLAVRMKLYPPKSAEAPFFCHAKGKYTTLVPLETRFRQLLLGLGLAKPKKGPRLHDMRHSFAVHRLYKWYQDGHNVQNKLPLLSTYLGHVSVVNTQVYLRITTALLREADRRFQAGFEDLAKKPMERAFRKQ
jgi:integrase